MDEWRIVSLEQQAGEEEPKRFFLQTGTDFRDCDLLGKLGFIKHKISWIKQLLEQNNLTSCRWGPRTLDPRLCPPINKRLN